MGKVYDEAIPDPSVEVIPEDYLSFIQRNTNGVMEEEDEQETYEDMVTEQDVYEEPGVTEGGHATTGGNRRVYCVGRGWGGGGGETMSVCTDGRGNMVVRCRKDIDHTDECTSCVCMMCVGGGGCEV